MKLRFLPAARRDLKEAISYYNERKAGLGEEFLDEVWDTVQRVKTFPETWHPLSSSIRRCQQIASHTESSIPSQVERS